MGEYKMSESLQLTVPLFRLRKMVDALKDKPDNTSLSFEFILLAFFPTAWARIQEAFHDYYTKGYIAGLAGQKNETEIST